MKNLKSHPVNKLNYRFQRIICMLYMTVLLAATVSAYKVVKIYSIIEPASTLIFTSSYFFGSLVAELYGQKIAKALIFEALICGLVFGVLITIVDVLPNANYLDIQNAYHMVLGRTLRFTFSGSLGFIMSSYINVHLLSKWKIKLHGKHYIIRSLGSSIIGEVCATFVTGLLTFFGLIPIKDIIIIMINAILFKIFYDFIIIWPVAFTVAVLKKFEVHTYQTQDDYDLNQFISK